MRRVNITVFLMPLLLSGLPAMSVQATPANARQVEARQCGKGLSVGEALGQAIKASNSLDRGWEEFSDGDGYIEDRSVAVSKVMAIHYRWHVSSDGHIDAANEASGHLCAS